MKLKTMTLEMSLSLPCLASQEWSFSDPRSQAPESYSLQCPAHKRRNLILSQPHAEQQILKYEDMELGSRISS